MLEFRPTFTPPNYRFLIEVPNESLVVLNSLCSGGGEQTLNQRQFRPPKSEVSCQGILLLSHGSDYTPAWALEESTHLGKINTQP